MATWVQYIGKVLPLTYSGDALTQIIIYGKNLTNLGGDLLALLIFLVVLLFLNKNVIVKFKQKHDGH